MNGTPPKPTAQIVIVLAEDGTVSSQAQVPSRAVALGMLEATKLDLDRAFQEQAETKVQTAPPGIHK